MALDYSAQMPQSDTRNTVWRPQLRNSYLNLGSIEFATTKL